jgi:hypothetical protein
MKPPTEFANTTHRVKNLYKGYVIEVQAPAVRTGGFTAHVCIRKEAKTYTDETLTHSGKVFTTANEALESGLEIGRRQIDANNLPPPSA